MIRRELLVEGKLASVRRETPSSTPDSSKSTKPLDSKLHTLTVGHGCGFDQNHIASYLILLSEEFQLFRLRMSV